MRLAIARLVRDLGVPGRLWATRNVRRLSQNEIDHSTDIHSGYCLSLVYVWIGLVVWCDGEWYWWRAGCDDRRKRVLYARHPTVEPSQAAQRISRGSVPARRRSAIFPLRRRRKQEPEREPPEKPGCRVEIVDMLHSGAQPLVWSVTGLTQRLGHRKDVLLKHYFVVRVGLNTAVVDDLDIDFGDGLTAAA